MHPKYLQRMDSPYNLRRDDTSNCESPDPANTLTDRLNTLLNSSGPGYILSLCPGEQYIIQAPILFAAPNQEISTIGYPTGDDRATLVVDGPVANGTGHTTAVDGTCANCDGVKLRNVQINGTRLGAPPTSGGANIEMGGANSDQLIEYVHSFDPRSWSCLHVSEGSLNCNNVTVQNNDVGPAGSDAFQQWADGISVACQNSLIRNNLINNPTDGGIVLFGSPGTRVENNTIWVETNTLLGGINMVDVNPFSGNYDGVVVTNNTIAGGFATEPDEGSETLGTNNYDVIIKIGIAIGPRTWFGNEYGNNVSTGGTVLNNQLTGAFSYGMAMSSATNFTVENNVLTGNTSFIGARGPNCSSNDPTPSPSAFVIDLSNVQQSTTQLDFAPVSDGDSLTCVLPPDGGDFWPFGGNPASNSTPPVSPPESPPSTPSKHSSTATTVGIVFGAIGAVLLIAALAWFIRKRALRRSGTKMHRGMIRSTSGYFENKY
ncbi:pectin lyase fold/virulence factor [Phlebopus sp. FC_14]|nr:pectin lyase fold/virulence factor [Phlebopus sp. FC_14]